MAKFWVDFSGYCKVDAENADEAEKKFWLWYNHIEPCFGVHDDVVDIDLIEENTSEEEG